MPKNFANGVLGHGKLVDVLVVLFLIIIIIAAIWYFRSSSSKTISHFQDPTIIKHKHGEYEILEIKNLLTHDQCDEIINHSIAAGMHESDVLSYGSSTGTEVNDTYRTSKTAWVQDREHPVAAFLAQYSAQISNLPIENQEMLQVAHYEPNGKFNEHFDACVYDDKEFCDKMNNYSGQRRCTLLVYLNDDFEGGETEFMNIGLKVKPEKGKAILFWNTDENEKIIEKSKHSANPVRNGHKWICTKWSHVKQYGG